MGYDLHITRKTHWSDEDGPLIPLTQWQQLIDDDADLTLYEEVGPEDLGKAASYGDDAGALRWEEGEIRAKNPESALVVKMAVIAAALGATLQGDDGEIYRADGSSFDPQPSAPPPRPSALDRIREWFREKRLTREFRQKAPAFKVGCRVKDLWGDMGTVLEIDRRANGGLGHLRVRMDDGGDQNLAYYACGLEIIGDAGGS